jgi:hemerythrin-like domain-containing protein
MKATDTLRGEHEVILGVLSALENIARDVGHREFDQLSAAEALDFLRNFADRCHHSKEEKQFFPALANHGLPSKVGPLAVMLGDHDQGRALLSRMADALDGARTSKPGADLEFARAANSYVDLMREHIGKENEVLFPMGDEMLSEADQAALLQEFERMEHDDMEAGAHERFLDLAESLCQRFGIEPAPVAAVSKCCGRHSTCKK